MRLANPSDSELTRLKASISPYVSCHRTMDGRFISYLRVSTQKQGANGLGIEAQRAAVSAILEWRQLEAGG